MIQCFMFLSRMADAFGPDETVTYQFTATPLQGRKLVTFNPDISIGYFDNSALAGPPNIAERRHWLWVNCTQLARQIAEAMMRFFELFPEHRIQLETLRGWVDKFEQRGVEDRSNVWKKLWWEMTGMNKDGKQFCLDLSGLPVLPPGWCWMPLSAIAKIKGGITKDQKRPRTATMREVPYLRVANVQRGFLDLTEMKTILAEEEEIEALGFERGIFSSRKAATVTNWGEAGSGMAKSPSVSTRTISSGHVYACRTCNQGSYRITATTLVKSGLSERGNRPPIWRR